MGGGAKSSQVEDGGGGKPGTPLTRMDARGGGGGGAGRGRLNPQAARNASRWQQRFQQLRRFVKRHRHARVPANYEANPALGRWVDTQRRAYRGECARAAGKTPTCSKRISSDRVMKLEGVGFVWEPTAVKMASARQGVEVAIAKALSWRSQFESLRTFVQEHGHARVPFKHPTLGRWVSRQRQAYRAERIRTQGRIATSSKRISGDKIRQLESLGFEWTTRGVPASSRSKSVVEQHRTVDAGDTAATNEQTAPTPSLPNAGITLPTAETTVEAGSPRSQSWQSGFDSLRIFAKHHGHMDVPRKYAKDPSLRGWVQMQRDAYRAERSGGSPRISGDKISKLENIGFEWESPCLLYTSPSPRDRG